MEPQGGYLARLSLKWLLQNITTASNGVTTSHHKTKSLIHFLAMFPVCPVHSAVCLLFPSLHFLAMHCNTMQLTVLFPIYL